MADNAGHGLISTASNNEVYCRGGRSQWPRGLSRSSAARPMRMWVRIPPGAWMFVCCECCVLSGRGLCDGLITHPEESYRMWRVVVCDLETSKMRRLKTAYGAVENIITVGCNARKTNKQTNNCRGGVWPKQVAGILCM